MGARRFDSHAEFDEWAAGNAFEPSPDGITLIQEYLRTREPFITRAEFVDGEFVYAVRVDTSAGSFELRPAEVCAATAAGEPDPPPLFRLRDDVDAANQLIVAYRRLLAGEGIAIAGVELSETVDGRLVTYDVNTNTNHNPDVEAVGPRSGPASIAAALGALLGDTSAQHPNERP